MINRRSEKPLSRRGGGFLIAMGVAVFVVACTGEFRDCKESATCPPPERSDGGSAGSESGGTGGDQGGSGAQGGTSGEGGTAGSGGSGAEGGSSGFGGEGGNGGVGASSGSAGTGAVSGEGGSGASGGDSGGASGASGSGGAGGSCTSVCTPNETEWETAPCGNCGEQKRSHVCDADGCSWGEWSDWDACSGEGVCEPETTNEVKEACEGCGSRSRIDTCLDTCEWSEGAWSECEKMPVCTPGELQKDQTPELCGNCGKSWRYRECATDGCRWENWGDYGQCEGEGECKPNDTLADEVACEMCGTAIETRTCSPTCEWGSPVTGECTGKGDCEPGDVEVDNAAACGFCDGTQSQKMTCKSTCEWGEWQATSSCIECTDDQLNSCNINVGQCQCTSNPNSCGTGNKCCVAPQGYRAKNFCVGTTVACSFLCVGDDAKCLDGYHCEGQTCVKD